MQLVTRLGIPIGIGITTAIWSSLAVTFDRSVTDLVPYQHVFIATLCFAAVGALVSPFAPLGKLGIASTATGPSLLLHEDTGLKNINLDGPSDWEEKAEVISRVPSSRELVGPESCPASCEPRFKIQQRGSSLGATAFHVSRIRGSRANADVGGLGLGFGLADSPKDRSTLQLSGTVAMAERVIWLVCEVRSGLSSWWIHFHGR